MSTSKYVFYLIYFIFHVLLIGGSIYMIILLGESNFGWINSFVIGDNLIFNEGNIIIFSVVGMVLFLVNVVLVNVQLTGANKRESKLENEVNSLKAKLYDLQDAQLPATKKKVEAGSTGESGPTPDKHTNT